MASTVGGIIGTFILILFSAPLARIALQFWPAEYFALAVLGLSSTSSMGGANWAKIIVATLLGLLISTVGMDPILGVRRFTFGILPLYDGFTFIPALIGLLALSEVFSQIEEFNFARATAAAAARTKWPSILDYWRLRMSILRSSIIGTIVGIFPGAGATIATFICYDVEKRVSKTPEMFGKGAPEGVAAAEASNSASVGGAMVPLLTLGIPGSATAAVLLGALMIHNLRPGPELFVKNPEIVYKLFGSMIVANFIMLLLGLVGSRIWVNVTKVRKEILFPLIFSFALIGSYAVKGSMFDVATAVGFGILGWVLRRYGYPMAPVILGLVLGKMAEVNYRRTIMMFGPIGLIQRPIANFLLVLAVISFIYPIILAGRARVRKARAASA